MRCLEQRKFDAITLHLLVNSHFLVMEETEIHRVTITLLLLKRGRKISWKDWEFYDVESLSILSFYHPVGEKIKKWKDCRLDEMIMNEKMRNVAESRCVFVCTKIVCHWKEGIVQKEFKIRHCLAHR